MWNLQTGSDLTQIVSTCSDCKIGGNQGKNRVVYSRLKRHCAELSVYDIKVPQER